MALSHCHRSLGENLDAQATSLSEGVGGLGLGCSSGSSGLSCSGSAEAPLSLVEDWEGLTSFSVT